MCRCRQPCSSFPPSPVFPCLGESVAAGHRRSVLTSFPYFQEKGVGGDPLRFGFSPPGLYLRGRMYRVFSFPYLGIAGAIEFWFELVVRALAIGGGRFLPLLPSRVCHCIALRLSAACLGSIWLCWADCEPEPLRLSAKGVVSPRRFVLVGFTCL